MILGLSFARPEAALGLLLLPVFWIGVAWIDGRRRKSLGDTVGPRASTLAGTVARRRRPLFAAGFACGVLAAMQPLWGIDERRVEQRGIDLLVCLDVSRSMLARDVAPDRLTRAKREIRALAARMRGDRLGLAVFAGNAKLAVPLTRDAASFVELVDAQDPLSVTRGGTDLAKALEVALAAFGDVTGNHEAVVLISDGEDNEGRGLRSARACKERNIVVHCFGIGSRLGSKIAVGQGGTEVFLRSPDGSDVVSKLDAGGLKRIAAATGGAYTDLRSSRQPLLDLFDDHISRVASKAFDSDPRRVLTNRYQWPLLAAFVLLVLALGTSRQARNLGMIGVLLLPASCGSDGAAAWEAYERGDFARALEVFTLAEHSAGHAADAGLVFNRALAALRAGQLETAELAAEKAAARGGPTFHGLRDFVFGNTAFARSSRAEAEALLPNADPTAFAVAIREAERARDAWLAAAARRDWPAARRNAARAARKLAELRKKKELADAKRNAQRAAPPPNPRSPQRSGKPDAERNETQGEATAQAATGELTAEQLERLLAKLVQKEREKRALRRAQQADRHVRGTKDW